MPKTYTSVPSVSTGDVYQASAYNTYTAQNVNNLIVPPTARVTRTSDLSSYTSSTAITWNGTGTDGWDTDGMWAAGSPTVLTVQTAGLYVVEFNVYWTAAATASFQETAIMVNGNRVAEIAVSNLSTGSFQTASAVLTLAATNTISAGVFFTGGSGYVIKGGSGQNVANSRLTATWIGRTS